MIRPAGRIGLHDPSRVHANCGVGAIADLAGRASHEIVELAFEALENLDHRGARGAEQNTGDGAGMLIQKPHRLFAAEVPGLPPAARYGVGQAFLPRDEALGDRLQALIEDRVAADSLRFLAWRTVPTGDADLGQGARLGEPRVRQFFVGAPEGMDAGVFDTRLYLLRRAIERATRLAGFAHDDFYLCSLDRRRVVYKGLLTCTQLRRYYPDLSDPRTLSALALVHSRFSTNTLGAWHLAHPYRCLVHNGEINTLRGNRNWMRAREAALASPRFGADVDRLRPLLDDGDSDSAALDQVLELLVESGRPLEHALRMMIPEAWHKDPAMSPERRAFYAFHAMLMEPWDGPALVVASDGERIVAALDRNGLRPCRIQVTSDRLLVLGSETGLIELPANRIVFRGRLRPGQLFLADPARGGIIDQQDIFAGLAAPPYRQWLEQHALALRDCPPAAEAPLPDLALARAQRACGFTMESLQRFLAPMARDHKDPIGAMGNDTPPAALSALPRPLFHYFSQLFAQVSNPPLDYLREALVTSLACPLGCQRNLLDATPRHCRQVLLDSPILSGGDLARLRDLGRHGLAVARIDTTCPPDAPFDEALRDIGVAAEAALADGCEILLLDDRELGPTRIALPVLLAVAGLHHHLLRAGLRARCGIVVDSGQPCRVHDFCTLLGYGADAVHPWLAYASVADLAAADDDPQARRDALDGYRAALEDGILKVMSKMGISTLQAYRGAQVFEALGLDDGFIDTYFTGTPCPVPGLGLAHFERQARALHATAFMPAIAGTPTLPSGGEFYWRRDGEAHQWTPQSIGLLQQAARQHDPAAYRAFAAEIDAEGGRAQTLRGLLEFVAAPDDAIPLARVEPVDSLLQRFSTGSMSFGALSREAHEALAIAMARIGGKSGSGEGGEQVERFGSERACSMKQIASGRFGVTAHYLANARQIEIKMAQGAKPGEGGELPGNKVGDEIAAVRFTTPGVGLISPPPHHDIYSIEDLAQLIHDLKCANPQAEIHVKLVAVANVGTIAAGVAKARADAILISGEAGGTGAARKTSIKSAGTAWEVGLAETQQVLVANRLRSRVRLRVDGGLKTARDVAVAALLGAEEFGFGTAALVALGCVMLRKCHCNTCSVGVATQDPSLRARFAGQPGHVETYLRFVAEDLRAIMARMGFATLDEMVGRVDRLRQRAVTDGVPDLDLSRLLQRPHGDDARRRTHGQQHGLQRHPDRRLIRAAHPALEHGIPVQLRLAVRNRDRAVGTMLSWAVTKRHGAAGLPPDTIVVRCIGSAGQSFAAFAAPGIRLALVGDANDYVGKGLSGAVVSIAPPADAGFAAERSVVVGNVALYGATAGQAYVRGVAGERFAVRNSGAMAVVEGIGDHGCEYMTAGVVVVLGEFGRNFAAGMSGGEAYVFDPRARLLECLNAEMVGLEQVVDERDVELLRRLLGNHLSATGSTRAGTLLSDWPAAAAGFAKVVPKAYAAVLQAQQVRGRDIRPHLPAPLLAA